MSNFSLSGGVGIFGFISPNDTTDTYAVIDPLYGIDGLRNIDLLSGLDTISTERRRAGMVVGVSGGTAYYKLNPAPWTNTFSDWSVFNTGGGSGSTVYSGSSPANTTVGGVTPGFILTGLTFSQILQQMLVVYLTPTFTSFSIQGQSQSLEVGATISGVKTFNWATSNSTNVQTNSIAIKDITGAVYLATGLTNNGSTTANIGSIINNSPSSYSWRAEGTNTQSTLFTSANFTVSWFFRLFYGTSSSATLTGSTIQLLLNNPLSNNKNGTYSFVAFDYKYFAWPDTFGSPTTATGFKDANTGFAVAMADNTDDPAYSNTQNGWNYALVSVTNGLSVTTNYRVYRTKNTLGGTITITVS